MKQSCGILSALVLWASGAARAGPVHHGRATSRNTQIITGLFGTPSADARIVIHDAAAQPSWTWSFADAGNVSDGLRRCAHDTCVAGGCAVPEAKWADGGSSVVAVYGFAVVVNHHPGRASGKQISFGVCTDRDGLANTHSAEPLPDAKLAVATTTPAGTADISIFDRRRAGDALAAPVLWAAGNDVSPLTQGSRSILSMYTYAGGSFQTTPRTTAVLADAVRLTAEWGGQTPWWDGAHAVVPVPGRDELLITTDLDVHLYRVDAGTVEHGQPVADKCLAGFQPAGARVGLDGVALPRSDIKSLSMLANGDTLYVQALWNQTYGESVGFLADGRMRGSMWNQMLYRSRWFTETVW
ncbi:hypothetical protein J3458_020295 [Metarhizium acridum]|uniref:uncharacterized protein n=1 Tax=Metarhizium acridum TaxID=92637 RepID=UPI001C6B02DA|nr:hypothetical protein J3458_020295 [Metarhizium acridum]